MIVYDDGERLMIVGSVYILTLYMDWHESNPGNEKNNKKLKNFIKYCIDSTLYESDQPLFETIYNRLGYKPGRCYTVTEIKNLYEKL